MIGPNRLEVAPVSPSRVELVPASPSRPEVVLASPSRSGVVPASHNRSVEVLANPHKPVVAQPSLYRSVVALANTLRALILPQECVPKMWQSISSPQGDGHLSWGRERASQWRRLERGPGRMQVARCSKTSEMAVDTSLQGGRTASRGHHLETKALEDPGRPGMGKVPHPEAGVPEVRGVHQARVENTLG